MLSTETNLNRKLIVNPEFKRLLLLLKTQATQELNIIISTEKMIANKEYRLSVLAELERLGSGALTSLLGRLKHTPVYIQSNAIQDRVEPASLRPIRKSYLLTVIMVLLWVIAVACFVSWQNGYLSISVGPHFQLQAEKPLSVRGVSESPSRLETQKPITLPISNPVITLRLHGSNTVGEQLAPALLEAYLSAQSITQMKWRQGAVAVERELQYVQKGKVYAIQLHAHGSATGFTALEQDKADVAMSSRRISPLEVTTLKARKGDLSDAGPEVIIGLDGIAIIVHKNNPLDSLSTETLAGIFSGDINNWQQLGGADIAINRYARDHHSGTWDTFNSLVLVPYHKQLDNGTERLQSSSELSDHVAHDMGGIGFIGLPYVKKTKALAISATEKSVLTYPTPFTVSTEDYALSRRLYLYIPSSDNQMAQQFSEFVISEAGQQVVERVGLVSQNIKLEEVYVVKHAPKNYNNYAQIAQRLSVNFRFQSGSNELDNKAQRDIKRLVDYLNKHRVRRIVLMGFSDSLEDPKMSKRLSLHRATMLEKALNRYGISVTAVEGFGEKLPIESNQTVQGRSKNRRVEVWVF